MFSKKRVKKGDLGVHSGMDGAIWMTTIFQKDSNWACGFTESTKPPGPAP